MQQDIVSKVWLLHGTFGGGTPGVLSSGEGRVSYITGEGEHFNVPVQEVKEVSWPFLQFGLGFNAVVNGQKYKFTFMKPNGAADLDQGSFSQLLSMTRGGRAADAIGSLANMGDSKKSAKQWKSLLGK